MRLVRDLTAFGLSGCIDACKNRCGWRNLGRLKSRSRRKDHQRKQEGSEVSMHEFPIAARRSGLKGLHDVGPQKIRQS
jgi:hypothetical protein